MTHLGVVTAVKPGFVTVQIESTSACAACAAHSKCGFAESKTKTLDIPVEKKSNASGIPGRGYERTEWKEVNVGDKVTVTIDETKGLLATWWAYVIPALLLLAAVIGFSLASLSEPVVILLSLAILGLYILILFLLRQKLDSQFTLSLRAKN